MAPFRFQDLPGELRNDIYGNVSLSDKMSLLRTSRFINSEVSPFFYREAAYHNLINVRFKPWYSRMPMFRPLPQHIKDKIQNLDVYRVLDSPEPRNEDDIEALDWDPHICRRTCRVFFKWNPWVTPWYSCLRNSDFGPLQTLAGFETVEIRVEMKTLGRLETHRAPGKPRGSKLIAWDLSCQDAMPMYNVLMGGLKSAFGIAELIQTPSDHYLRFQPRKHQAHTCETHVVSKAFGS